MNSVILPFDWYFTKHSGWYLFQSESVCLKNFVLLAAHFYCPFPLVVAVAVVVEFIVVVMTGGYTHLIVVLTRARTLGCSSHTCSRWHTLLAPGIPKGCILGNSVVAGQCPGTDTKPHVYKIGSLPVRYPGPPNGSCHQSSASVENKVTAHRGLCLLQKNWKRSLLQEAEAVNGTLPRDPSHSFRCQRALALSQTSHCGPWKCSKESLGSRTTCGWGPGQQRVVRQEFSCS